jgi:iron complex transport system substrate-binding protein
MWPLKMMDFIGKSMSIDRSPMQRIISLTPSLTETLYALGLGDCVVGITDSCDYPPAVLKKPNVSCWFDPDSEKIFKLKPDLVLGSEKAHGKMKSDLEEKGIQVFFIDPETVDQALDLMGQLGRRLGVPEKADGLIGTLKKRLIRIDTAVSAILYENRLTVSRVLEWDDDSFYVAGPLSFQYDVISRAGGKNITTALKADYPIISFEQFLAWDPEIIFVCGYDRNLIPNLTRNPNWRRLRAIKSERVYQFHCGLTCRTGPRIVDMTERLYHTIYGF